MKKHNKIKMVHVKSWLRRLSMGMLLLPIVACSNGSGTGKSGSDAASIEANKSKEPVHLVFYSTAAWTQEAFNERFGDAMRKRFPDYSIEFIANGKGTTFQELLTAGTVIDIYWQDVNSTIPQMMEYDLQYDMTDLIKKHGIDLNTLDPASINIIKEMSGGKMYALPLVNNTSALYYNKDLFDKFGIPYPKDGITWDEVMDLTKKMRRTDNGQEYYGLVSNFQPHANLSPLSVPLLDPKTEKPTIMTDERWKILFDHLITAKRSLDNKTVSFVRDRNVAMAEELANIFLNNDMTGYNWDLVAYPTFKEAPNKGPQPLPTLFGITSVSKQKEAAMEVLKYMLSEEQQLSLSERAIIPVLQNEKVLKAFGTKSKYANVNFQAILKRKFTPIAMKTKYEAKVRDIYAKSVLELAKGTVDMNTAFRQMDDDVNKMITADKAK
ncbi:ABC transporter substrate-binding protein [Paenibacillus allorhizosphaerae]|uniref:Extracellular solute-binding protein n=1 Tax=Paenibacillus allorhizosphaerae TaxID=2849866 RepID=A0ABM8VDG0_9BACL|nr:extracellular solute-binding protein [Paenibacillus allorhizosphaerae]CAG7627632.1 hypothetical protein PAECIP111802_01373 [Paenibacillus allorhizosphaerae]